MKKNLLVLSIFLLFIGVVITGYATGSKEKEVEKKKESKAQEKPLITLNVFSMLSNYAGEQTGWYAKVIKDRFNITLNIISSNVEGGAARLQALMSSGDLGDIVVMGDDSKDYHDCLAGGLLSDWTKDGLLEKYDKDILARAPGAIEKNKKAYGAGNPSTVSVMMYPICR
jgi:putative aldouronate transport system substrate-binding protein